MAGCIICRHSMANYIHKYSNYIKNQYFYFGIYFDHYSRVLICKDSTLNSKNIIRNFIKLFEWQSYK